MTQDNSFNLELLKSDFTVKMDQLPVQKGTAHAVPILCCGKDQGPRKGVVLNSVMLIRPLRQPGLER